MSLFSKIVSALFIYACLGYAQECTSELTVNTNSSTSKIYLNNQLTGTGSLKKEIKTGTYFLNVMSDSASWNSQSFSDSFEVADCNDDKQFSYNFNEQVYLQSDPMDTYVFSGDSLIGHTPLHLTNNISTIRLSKPGYEDKFVDYSALKENGLVHLNQAGEKKEPLFIQRDLFKILVGSAVVLGSLTAYFKLKADNHFEEYQLTGSQKELDKTHQLDTISGITFGSLQVNFGVLIYYFLTE